jgi:hypothetical protein
MKKMKLTLIATCMLAAFSGQAQRIKVTEGSLEALKGVTAMKVQYDYSDFKVGGKTETDYVNEKVVAYNKKEAGKGDKWLSSWKADREGRYERQFEEKFEEFSNIDIDTKGSGTYTMIVKTRRIEPGFNIYVKKKFAELDSDIWIVETANPGKVIAKVTSEGAPGRTYGSDDFDTGVRIAEAYEMTGKAFGKYLKKEIK